MIRSTGLYASVMQGTLMFRARKDDCIFLTQEYRLKEFSVILQQQFAYHFNATKQTVCSISMYILRCQIYYHEQLVILDLGCCI